MDGVLSGRLLGGGAYRVGKLLGEGAMGAVYEGVQEALGRAVAIKVLHAAHGQLRPDQFARFQREARAAAALGHANIVQITDFQWQTGEPPFLVMERLAGQSLGDAIRRSGQLPPQRVAFIASQVLSALAVAHASGIVHRDIKPDNVFLTLIAMVNDIVKLLDFGVAKLLDEAPLTLVGAMVGSPAYMPPEQAFGREVDGRADIYAVGATMYHALSGRLPVEAADVAEFLAHVERPARPLVEVVPGFDPALSQLVARAMEKRPEDRFATADDMRRALGPWAKPNTPSMRELTAQVPSRASSGPMVAAARSTGSYAAPAAAVVSAPFATGSHLAPAPGPGFATGSHVAPAPGPGFATGSHVAPAPGPGFATGSHVAPAPGPGFATGSHVAPAPGPGFATGSQAPAPLPGPGGPPGFAMLSTPTPSNGARAGVRGALVAGGVVGALVLVAVVAALALRARPIEPVASDAAGTLASDARAGTNGSEPPIPSAASSASGASPHVTPGRRDPPAAPTSPPSTLVDAGAAPQRGDAGRPEPVTAKYQGCQVVVGPGAVTFENDNLRRNPRLQSCEFLAKDCKIASRSKFSLGYHVTLGNGGRPTGASASRDNFGCAADFCFVEALKVHPFVHTRADAVDVTCTFTR